jgi:hypothetical protein
MPALNLHRNYHCQCGRPVFFPNSVCLACATQLGYRVQTGELIPLAPGTLPESWVRFGDNAPDSAVYYRCANFDTPAQCNWLVDRAEFDGNQHFCVACRLNRTIPDLTLAENATFWYAIETAKRRLVSSLVALDLPVKSRIGEDPEHGLAFDFLHAKSPDEKVLTGHDDGVITLNIEEANDATREAARLAMHEPYRTLIGHLRHEVGHYYWDRLVDGTPWLDRFRDLFGDERADYGEALKSHYENGPSSDWPLHFVSAYAASHPWEDWAETWAQYLHLRDLLDTAASFGLHAAGVELDIEPFAPDTLTQSVPDQGEEFLRIVNDAAKLTGVLNEMSRSMGLADIYPFVLSRAAVDKLHLVHRVVTERPNEGALQNPNPDIHQDTISTEAPVTATS